MKNKGKTPTIPFHYEGGLVLDSTRKSEKEPTDSPYEINSRDGSPLYLTIPHSANEKRFVFRYFCIPRLI